MNMKNLKRLAVPVKWDMSLVQQKSITHVSEQRQEHIYEYYISGLASVFGVKDQQNDIVDIDAFTESLQLWNNRGKTPFMLLEHKISKPIGRWISLKTTEKGIAVEGKILFNLPAGREAIKLFSTGMLGGLSIGYEMIQETELSDNTRLILKGILHEISMVSNPANQEAIIHELRQRRISQ